MKNFKKYLVFVLAVSLSLQQGMYAAASSSAASSSSPAAPSVAAASSSRVSPASSSQQAEPAVEYHDSGMPTHLADYLAETSFFKWLGNYITTCAQEMVDARKKSTVVKLKKNWEDKIFRSVKAKLDTQDPKELAKYLHDCRSRREITELAKYMLVVTGAAIVAANTEPLQALCFIVAIFATANQFYSIFKDYKETTTTTNNIKAQLATLKDSELSQLIAKVMEGKKPLTTLKAAVIQSIVSEKLTTEIPDFESFMQKSWVLTSFGESNNPTEPLAPWQYLLLCGMQIFAQIMPNTTRYPTQETYGIDLHKYLIDTAQKNRLERFDVCHERLDDLKQCCTIHDNTRIECCLIDTRSGLEICKTIYLIGHPSKTHTFKNEEPKHAQPPFDPTDLKHSSLVIDYPLLSQFAAKLTTNTSVTPGLAISNNYALDIQGSPAAYSFATKRMMFTQELFLTNPDAIPPSLAHELGHHQQYANNFPLQKNRIILSFSFIEKLIFIGKNIDIFFSGSTQNIINKVTLLFLEKISEKSVRAFNIEFNADIHAYLLTENAALIDFFLFATNLKLNTVDNSDHCSLPLSLIKHPDSLTCRIPLLAELHEKYPRVVKKLEKAMVKARAQTVKSSDAVVSSSGQ